MLMTGKLRRRLLLRLLLLRLQPTTSTSAVGAVLVFVRLLGLGPRLLPILLLMRLLLLQLLPLLRLLRLLRLLQPQR